MAVPGIDFRFSNRADWREEFAVQVGTPVTPPWVAAAGVPGVPAWAPNAACDLASACVVGADLYVARSDPAAGAWISAPTFEADLLPSGLSRWLLVAAAKTYARKPYDFTGAGVCVGLKACNAAGDILDPRPKLLASTADEGFTVTNPRLGGLAWTLPLWRARGIAAGLYRYDIAAKHLSGALVRVRYGLLLVDDGCTS